MQMLKEFSTKYYQRSCAPNEFTKPIDINDFVKYDNTNLWKTSYEVMCEQIPKIEEAKDPNAPLEASGLKTDISPILSLKQKYSERKNYYDPLKKYAEIAETEGNHIERNPLNNHKLIQNSYFPMSRLVGSYWDKVDKESYFRNRYDNMEFNPEQRDSGYSTNNEGHIDFSKFFPTQKSDNTETEYRKNFWREKGFPFKRPQYKQQ